MRQTLLTVFLVAALPSFATADDWYRPISWVAWADPYHLYYSQVYDENSCDGTSHVSYYLREAPLLDTLAWPCPPTESLFGGHVAPPVAFQGLDSKMDQDGDHTFGHSDRRGWEAKTPSRRRQHSSRW